MAQAVSLEANKRTMTGKRVRQLRAKGQIPAVIYGTVVPDPISITVAERDLLRTYQAVGGSTMIDLNVDGDSYTVYIRNLHMNPVARKPLHAEFFAPNLLMAMTASVPIHLRGEPDNDRLIVMHTRDSVELHGLPANLPGAMDVDISGLVAVDDSIFVRDLPLPEGVELVTDPDELIVRLTEPRVAEAEEEVAVEGVEGEEAAEGEEPESDESEENGE